MYCVHSMLHCVRHPDRVSSWTYLVGSRPSLRGQNFGIVSKMITFTVSPLESHLVCFLPALVIATFRTGGSVISALIALACVI